MGQKSAFTRSEHCEPNVGGWPWQILGALRAVATVWEAAETLFFL